MRLVPTGWLISRLKYTLPVDKATLLVMRVEAHEPPTTLSTRRKGRSSVPQEESFFRWMRMPQGSARRHGESRADMCALPPSSSTTAETDPANFERDHALSESDEDDEADGMGDLFDTVSAGLIDEDNPDLDLQAELLAVLEADLQAQEVQDGGDTSDEDGGEGEPGVAASSSAVAEPSTAIVDETILDQAAAAADAAEAHPPGTEFGLDGQQSLSTAGYVRVAGPPFDGKIIGLVGTYADRRTVFANCHLHPHCAIKCGVVLRPVSRMKLAEWLAKGEPSEGMPIEDRRKLGKEHRARWSRDGPLG